MLREIDLTNKCGSCRYFEKEAGTAHGYCLKNPYGDDVVHDPKHPYWQVARSRGKCVKYWEKIKPLTNADRIRAMRDEELAWITVREIKVWNYVEGYYDAEYKCSDGYVTDDYRAAIDHEVAWIKQPVKEDEQ